MHTAIVVNFKVKIFRRIQFSIKWTIRPYSWLAVSDNGFVKNPSSNSFKDLSCWFKCDIILLIARWQASGCNTLLHIVEYNGGTDGCRWIQTNKCRQRHEARQFGKQEQMDELTMVERGEERRGWKYRRPEKLKGRRTNEGRTVDR